MSKQTTRSTKKSLGLVSDRDIDLWNSDVKTKANTRQMTTNIHRNNKGLNSLNN